VCSARANTAIDKQSSMELEDRCLRRLLRAHSLHHALRCRHAELTYLRRVAELMMVTFADQSRIAGWTLPATQHSTFVCLLAPTLVCRHRAGGERQMDCEFSTYRARNTRDVRAVASYGFARRTGHNQ
jgi:hypothetical protein